jgi:glycosyltransferase involved in cell wall biosynthesis
VPPDLPLTIVAPHPEPQVHCELRALAESKCVRFAYGLSDDALVREYRRASSIVLPSVYRSAAGETKVPELLGQTLLEGMACETPAVCTNVASMPEVVEHGVSGFVVPANDPRALGARLAWLHRHRAEGDAMGRAGRQRVLARFTWPLVVERCLEAYTGAPVAERLSQVMAQ